MKNGWEGIHSHNRHINIGKAHTKKTRLDSTWNEWEKDWREGIQSIIRNGGILIMWKKLKQTATLTMINLLEPDRTLRAKYDPKYLEAIKFSCSK